VYVLLVSAATVGLWCANGALADVFGEMGVIAVLPMVAFFGFGVLGKARAPACPGCVPCCGARQQCPPLARVQLCECAGHPRAPGQGALRRVTCALHTCVLWACSFRPRPLPRMPPPSGPLMLCRVTRLRLAAASRPGVTLGRRAALPESSGA